MPAAVVILSPYAFIQVITEKRIPSLGYKNKIYSVPFVNIHDCFKYYMSNSWEHIKGSRSLCVLH